MKRYITFSIKLLISLTLFATFVAFTEKPQRANLKEEKTTELIARRGHGHHGRRGHHGRHGRGGGIYFRFDVGPPRERYYYHTPYHEYVRVNCEIFDDSYAKVKEVQIDRRVIYLNGAGDGSRYIFSLRPGYHTIRWRVENKEYLGSKYRNYSRSFRVHRDRDEMDIIIKGSSISIR